MKTKTLVLLGLAICCGLLASFMTSRLLAQRSAAPATDEDDKVTVLVAKQKLTFGQRLDIPENYLEEKSYTLDQVPSKALRKFEDAQGRLVMANFIAQGTAVTSDQLMDASSMGAGGMVPAGKCIVGIRTNAVNTAGGLILPQSHVDVLLTVPEEARIILSNALVFAIDTHVKVDANSPVIPQTVTLLVDPSEAATVTLAGKQGELSLLPRGIGDNINNIGVVIKRTDVGRKIASNTTPQGSGDGADLTRTKSIGELLPRDKTDPGKGSDDDPLARKLKKAFWQELHNGSEKIYVFFDHETGKAIPPEELDQYDVPKSK